MVRMVLVTLLEPHSQPKQLQDLIEVFEYYGSEEFMGMLLFDRSLKPLSDMALTSVENMVQPLLIGRRFDTSMVELCGLPHCRNFRLMQIKALEASDGSLLEPLVSSSVSTAFCCVHHAERYVRLLQQPNVLHFLLGDGRDYYPFVDMAKSCVGRHVRRFYKGTVRYERSAIQNRLAVAQEIWTTFLAKGCKRPMSDMLPPDMIQNIWKYLQPTADNEKLVSEPRLPPDLFSAAQGIAFGVIQSFFYGTFLPSPVYGEYLEEYRSAIVQQKTRESKILFIPVPLFAQILDFLDPGSLSQCSLVHRLWTARCNPAWIKRLLTINTKLSSKGFIKEDKFSRNSNSYSNDFSVYNGEGDSLGEEEEEEDRHSNPDIESYRLDTQRQELLSARSAKSKNKTQGKKDKDNFYDFSGAIDDDSIFGLREGVQEPTLLPPEDSTAME